MTETVELVHKTLKYLLQIDSIYSRIFTMNRMERESEDIKRTKWNFQR